MNPYMLVPLFTVVIILIYFYDALKHFIIRIKHLRRLPGPPATNILLGNGTALMDTPENLFKFLRKWGTEYYPIYNLRLSYAHEANMVDPHDFEIVMSNTQHNTKGQIYNILHGWLGTGLLTSSGNKWQVRRKILTPSFHFNILQEFIKVFTEETKNLVEVFKNECHKPFVPVTDFISDFTLRSIGETAMGTSLKEEMCAKEYKRAVHGMAKVCAYRFSRPWLCLKLPYFFSSVYFKERRLLQVLHTFTKRVISKRSHVRIEDSYSKRKRLAMLDLLLTAKQAEGFIDDDGIEEEVNTFMFEGHDTISVALCYALMLIACHPDAQDKIYAEIQTIVSDPYDLDYKVLQELKYIERCIKEVLRLYPSVPHMSRMLGEDIITHSGYELKAGSMVHLHIYDVHHNPDIYPDPEKFDPDRFLPENSQKRHNFAYVPFSAGPRNCIGKNFAMLEMKAVLCGILSEFILEPVDTPSTIALYTALVLRTKDPIRVRFVPRVRN